MSLSDLRQLRESLADPAVLGDPETLREQTRAAEQPPVLADQYDGADESGAVWVAVDPRHTG